MIDSFALSEIVRTYEKYGWLLRRVLLSGPLKKGLEGQSERLFGDALVSDSTIDAAWFSRPPTEGQISWEIRYLGEPAYALLEFLDENAPEFEDQLLHVEQRLSASVAAKRKA